MDELRWRAALRVLVAPRSLVGLGAGLTLLAVLGGLADWQEVWATARRLPGWLLALSATSWVVGGLIRAMRWVLMLRLAGVRVSAGRALAAHFGAELLGLLPASPFAAAYFLYRSGVPPAASAPVVVAAFWTDALYAISGTALVPMAPPGVRLLAVLGVVGLLLGALLIWLLPGPARSMEPVLARVAVGGQRRLPVLAAVWRMVAALPEWSRRGSAAFSPLTLALGVALLAPVWALGVTVTSLIAEAAGFSGFTPWRVWATSGAQFAVTLASPLPFDLGISEGASVLAYSWAGMPAALALVVSLVGRLWSLTVSPTLALLAILLLRRELSVEGRQVGG